MEKWKPLDWVPCKSFTLDKVEHIIQFENDKLELTLSSSDKTNLYNIIFQDVFSYRVTMEHFLCGQYTENEFKLVCPHRDACIYQVQNSLYIEELNQKGMYDLHSELRVLHFILLTDIHNVDVIVHEKSKIIINNALTKDTHTIFCDIL